MLTRRDSLLGMLSTAFGFLPGLQTKKVEPKYVVAVLKESYMDAEGRQRVDRFYTTRPDLPHCILSPFQAESDGTPALYLMLACDEYALSDDCLVEFYQSDADTLKRIVIDHVFHGKPDTSGLIIYA